MDELYIVARRVLLDALEALRVHLDAVVVVGAQAIYLRVGEADLAVAAYTTDGDLGIEPTLLVDTPALEAVLATAEIAPPSDEVGIWTKNIKLADGTPAQVCIDLLVPRGIAPDAGRRSVRLKGHHSRAARAVVGLEGAVVDFDRMVLTALEPTDPRSIEVRVAGAGALLIAKVHKISERSGTERQKDKDALDVLRLLRGTSSDELTARVNRLLADERSRGVTEAALTQLPELFARRGAKGIEMVINATKRLADPEEITASCEILTTDLLRALGR